MVRFRAVLAVSTVLAGLSLVAEAHAQAVITSASGLAGGAGGWNTTIPPFYPSQWGTVYSGAYPLEAILDLASFPKKDPVRGYSNGYFDAGAYGANCSTGLYIENIPAQPGTGYAEFYHPGTPAVIVPLCSAVTVPVVDSSFLDKLSAANLAYHLVYPIQDNGNGRAYVVWHSKELEPVWRSDSPMFAPVTSGYARIEGVGWQDQFQPYTFTPINSYTLAKGSPITVAHGDGAGDFIAGLPSPKRETTIRLEAPAAVPYTSGSFRGFAATMVQDDWLAGTPPAPPPPALPPPPIVANRAPNSINFGQAGSAAGLGLADGANASAEGSAAFDLTAYCSAPSHSGKPRSASWIRNCIANVQK